MMKMEKHTMSFLHGQNKPIFTTLDVFVVIELGTMHSGTVFMKDVTITMLAVTYFMQILRYLIKNYGNAKMQMNFKRFMR